MPIAFHRLFVPPCETSCSASHCMFGKLTPLGRVRLGTKFRLVGRFGVLRSLSEVVLKGVSSGDQKRFLIKSREHPLSGTRLYSLHRIHAVSIVSWCNVQQKSLYQFLKISFKFKKCAISNKSIQNGRPSRSPKKDKKEPKKAREPRKNPRNPRGQCQRPQKN